MAAFSLTIAFVYLFSVFFQLFSFTQKFNDIPPDDVMSLVLQSMFVVLGVLVSIALCNSRRAQLSFIGLSWAFWMFANVLLALFIVHSGIFELVSRKLRHNSEAIATNDALRLLFDSVHLINIPASMYLLSLFLCRLCRHSKKIDHRRPSTERLVKKQFEVTNEFVGDEDLCYV